MAVVAINNENDDEYIQEVNERWLDTHMVE